MMGVAFLICATRSHSLHLKHFHIADCSSRCTQKSEPNDSWQGEQLSDLCKKAKKKKKKGKKRLLVRLLVFQH